MRKKKAEEPKRISDNPNVLGLHGETTEQMITDTLEQNYMPYAMSVIVSRAIPEIDGFKPSHRKLLYTMYKMGLLSGSRTKSANIVGQTMRLNPHGDAAIYETMVRLSAGNQSLLMPFVDSKGNFGKVYSRDMSYAASRYTEAKLSKICTAVFDDIDKDSVDFADNYDGTMKEPLLLPTAFPNVLVSANSGIAVGMASQICGFNLNEVCNAAIALLQEGEADLLSIIPAPDFPTGAEILYDRSAMESIYRTGRGSVALRAKWRYHPKDNLIEITEIPYTTTCEAILDKVADLIKSGKNREINDMRDETDLSGLRLAIDLKRGTDPEKLMQKLFKSTTLQDSFPCNFNILIEGNPRVMGVQEILEEWIAWRTECVRRRIYHELSGKKQKLHLLRGLEQILLDIDRAIEIIRNTEMEADVIPNLMMGFGIDEEQAEFVAEIRLRNINREYILKRTAETEALEKNIAELESILNSRRKLKKVLIDELTKINQQFPTPRRSTIVYADQLPDIPDTEPVPEDPVTVFLSKEGYFKKISPQSLRMSSEQKFKEGDTLRRSLATNNAREILFLTDQAQIYKLRLSETELSKASSLGSYLPTLLKMDEGESILDMIDPADYSGTVLLAFANGKIAHVPVSVWQTKTNRKKLVNAFSSKSPLIGVLCLSEAADIAVYTDDMRALVFHSSLIPLKPTRSNQGNTAVVLRGKKQLKELNLLSDTVIKDPSRYRARSIPKSPVILRPEDTGEEQLSIL